jgi:hypothetical protein
MGVANDEVLARGQALGGRRDRLSRRRKRGQ